MSDAVGGAGSFAEGLAHGYGLAQSMIPKTTLASKTINQKPTDPAPLTSVGPQTITSSAPDLTPAPAPPAANPVNPIGAATDPVAPNLGAPQKALLNTIAAGESGGQYNVRYSPSGPATFDSYDNHPGVMEPGPAGPSSAAGRYGFTKTTWDGLGGGAFEPANQDNRALALASQQYKAATGKDLMGDLQSGGLTPQILKVLSPTWTSLGVNPQAKIATYNQSMQRYQSASQQPTVRVEPWAHFAQFYPNGIGPSSPQPS